jgi:hypothetical protein
VATDASQLDLDVFGVDFGDGLPVAAFQVKKSDTDCCVYYRIYSLEKPPRLLRVISGGGNFSAADIDLSGEVEIWTDDAKGIDGFENLALGEFDAAPTVIFRFAHSQLRDVSAEFQSYFDNQIATLRMKINKQDLEDFKNSDGKLKAVPAATSIERQHRLRMAKIKVLEIVWAYLYSGREQDAWRSLADMWPSADVDRIRIALLDARAHGICGQADDASTLLAHTKKKREHIFDAVSSTGPDSKLDIIPPQAILLQRPPVSEIGHQGNSAELLVDLVVDEAGKVRSAQPAEKVKWVDPELINAAFGWKFIPAFRDGRQVASRLRLAVSLTQ